MDSALNTGDTAWLLTSAALVLLMIPGLAFFYGGMVRVKSVLNMLMMVMGALFVVGVLWVLFGYSMAFGDSYGQAGLLGNVTQYLGLEGLMADNPEAAYPAMAFVAFQAMFACITVGLIAGAVADRMKYAAWLVFAGLWATARLLPRRALGVQPGRRQRRLALQVRRHRLRRRHGGPHQRRHRRPGAGHRPRQADRLAEDADAAAQPHPGDDRRRACCGSAGSASTPARPPRPTTPRPWPS